MSLLQSQFAFGQDAAAEDSSPYSSAELVVESAWIQPGKPFTVGLRLSMDEGWHSYWQNPGDSGEPTDIEWDVPSSFDVGNIQWPYPHRIDAGPLTSYGYSDELILLTDISPPADLAAGTTLDIEAVAYWLICEEICLPAEEAVSISIPVRDEVPQAADEAGAIARARAQLPVSPENWSIEAISNSGSYVLQLTPPSGTSVDMEGVYFFASDYATIEHAAPQPVSSDDGSYLLALQQSEYASDIAERLRGVLVAAEGAALDTDGSARALRIDVAVEEAGPVDQIISSESESSILWLLLLAFTGGVLLNLMPCVFPVLSIKILGFARQVEEKKKAIHRHGFVFGGGVIISFWVLAALLLSLRAGGNQIGWGFQLQSPLFVALMAMLFVGIGLSLMGVFEMGSSLMRWGGRVEQTSTGGGYRGSFLSGVLATVVATPCTAPFMGAALGATLVLPVMHSFLIFTALGLGMAAPYMMLSMAPGLLQRLPRPGPWMETLKHILAFPMFATAVWLVWVFGKQTGVDGVALLLTGLLLLGVALWIIGHWPAVRLSSAMRIRTRIIASILVLFALSTVYAGSTYNTSFVQDASGREEVAWQSFSNETVEQYLSAGQPVFIDFTAAWCLTCQVNKRTTLNNVAVQEAFERKGVKLFKADWTNQDADITRALERYGRSGVPLYVLYTGSSEDPVLLPEILTEAIVLEALEELPDRAGLST